MGSDDEFQCYEGECIPKSKRFNGNDDCGDNSDERPVDCNLDEFRCEDGRQCIPISKRCDGIRGYYHDGCLDYSDEWNCPGFDGLWRQCDGQRPDHLDLWLSAPLFQIPREIFSPVFNDNSSDTIEYFKCLLEKSYEANLTTVIKREIMGIAMKSKNIELVSILMKESYKTFGRLFLTLDYDMGKTFIQERLYKETDADVVDFLIRLGNDSRISKYTTGDVNYVDFFGNTPLFQAAGSRNEKKMKVLLDNGADVNFKNNKNITAFATSKMMEPLQLYMKIVLHFYWQ